MPPLQVAIVSETEEVPFPALSAAAAALQRQLMRDVRPLWGVHASVSAFPMLEDVPSGYWPVVVAGGPCVAAVQGVHLDSRGQPFAIAAPGQTWSLTLSHLILELLIDPSGNRLYTGPSPLDDLSPVEFLLAACDPCAGVEFAYQVDGVLVSDFITPAYAQSDGAVSACCSFTGAVSRPRQVLPGGCLSWVDPVGRLVWQESHFGPTPQRRQLGVGDRVGGSLREWVDARTRIPVISCGVAADHERLRLLAAAVEVSSRSSASRAQTLHGHIRELGRRGT